MVYKTILKHKKKILIPTAVFSGQYLSSIFNQAKAEAIKPTQEEINRILNDGVINKLFINGKNELEGAGVLGSWETFVNTWQRIGETIVAIIDFFKNFNENVAQLSIDFLAHMYELIAKIVLQTPTLIFDNPYLKDANFSFAWISVIVVSLLTMIESIKKMFRQKNTDFKKIMQRYAIAVTASGFAPFLFEKIFSLLNLLSQSILKIGSLGIQPSNIGDYMQFTGLNTIILILFDLAVLAMMIPVFLQNGRRWFDILSLSMITPLALSAWVFDDYKHLFSTWKNSLKRLASVQLIYAVFLAIMTIFIFGTRYITSGDGLIIKMLIIVGGLWRMLNPPSIVSSADNGTDIIGMGKDIKKTYNKAKKTLTGKPINLNPVKNYISWVKGNFKDK